MGLFKKKQPSVSTCDMCGKTEAEGCGSAINHCEQISEDEPVWLPPTYRRQAVGEYTWLCTRCNSYPNLKWPGEGGASASMQGHLGNAHHVGQFANMHMPVNFDMVEVR